MKKAGTVLILISVFILITGCSKFIQPKRTGIEKFWGSSAVIRNGKSTPITKKFAVQTGDRIVTRAGGGVILRLQNGIGRLEIQENSEFLVEDYAQPVKRLTLLKGNVWTKITKLGKGEQAVLTTPRTVAAVRGTKFYTFGDETMYGTCHCEGDIEWSDRNTGYKGGHLQNDLVITFKGRTIRFSGKELAENIGISHDHSDVADSPLGKKLDPEADRKTLAYIMKRFGE